MHFLKIKGKIISKKASDLSNFLQQLHLEKTGVYTNITEKFLSNPDFLKLSYDLIKNKKGNFYINSSELTMSWFKRMAQNIKNNALKFNTKHDIFFPKKRNSNKIPIIKNSWCEKVIQKAIYLIFEEIYKNRDTTFSKFSYMFYSNKSLYNIFWVIKHKWVLINWFVKVNIKNTFNNINYSILINKLKLKIRDLCLNNILLKMFKANIISIFGTLKENENILQSSILSQILINVYFQSLDCKIKKDFILQYNVGIKATWSEEYEKVIKLTKKEQLEIKKKVKFIVKKRLQAHKEKISPVVTESQMIRVYYIRYVDKIFVGVLGYKKLATEILNSISTHLKLDLQLFLNKQKSEILSSLLNKISFLGMLFYNGRFEKRLNRKSCKTVAKKKVCTRVINCVNASQWKKAQNLRKNWLYWITNKYRYSQVVIKKDFKFLVANLNIFGNLFFKRNRFFYRDFLKKLQEIIERKQNEQLCYFVKLCEEKYLDSNKNLFTKIWRPILKYEIIERIVILLQTNHAIPAYSVSWPVLFKDTNKKQVVFKPIWPEDFELSEATIFKLQKFNGKRFTGQINKQAICLAIMDLFSTTKNLNIPTMVFKPSKNVRFFSDVVSGRKRFPIQINADVNKIYKYLIKASIINKKRKPISKASIIKFKPFLIIFYFKKVVNDLLFYFRCADNFYIVKIIVNYFIRYSFLHTLAHKHKCSLRVVFLIYGQEIKTESLKNSKKGVKNWYNAFFKYLSKC